MTYYYSGEYTIGGALPGAQAAAVAGSAGINAALPDILARLAALQAFAPLPVSFAAQLSLANQLVTGIQTSIALGIPEPSIAAQIAAVAALVAELVASVSAINVQLSIVADFQSLLAAAGLHVYVIENDANAIGADIYDALQLGLPGGGGATEVVSAILLVTNVGATWAALQGVFAT